LVTGIAVVVLTICVLIFATCSRLLNPDRMIERLTPAGLWNIILLLTATLFWAAAAARLQQPVLSLILSALLVWWTSLMIPSAVGTYLSAPGVFLPLQPVWWTWTFQLQFGAAALLLIAAVFQELGYRSRRNRAWPDRLDNLLEPYSRWPAYTHTECVIAAVVLILGVYHIVRPGPPSAPLSIANCAVAWVAGITCLFMTYRRWSANSAGLGMALLTLAAVAMACSGVLVLSGGNGPGTYATRLPIVFNAVLFAMTLMIALWRWLSRFWEQQLLDGLPWTTSGRMIPYAQRAAYLSTALAVLVAYQMALWPWRVASSVEDNSLDRFIWGLLALALLTFVTVRGARRAQSSASAALGVAVMIAAAIFVFVRLPAEEYHAASVLRGWLTQYDAVVLGTVALPVLMIAEVLPKTKWRNFAQPLWWLALLLLPAIALLELTGPRRLPADWVRPATLAILGVLYLLAGRREHRRAMLALGAVLLLASATTLYRSYAPAQRTVSITPSGMSAPWQSDARLRAVCFRHLCSCDKLQEAPNLLLNAEGRHERQPYPPIAQAHYPAALQETIGRRWPEPRTARVASNRVPRSENARPGGSTV
jgi:hypothetical protein